MTVASETYPGWGKKKVAGKSGNELMCPIAYWSIIESFIYIPLTHESVILIVLYPGDLLIVY